MNPISRAPRATLAVVTSLIALTALAATAPGAHALEVKRMKLDNGAVLLVSEQPQLPMVTVAISFDAGSRRDPKGEEGLAYLTAHCLTLGTTSISAPEFDRKVDFMGSSISVDASRDYATASMTSLKKYEGQTLALMAGILQTPGLRDADIIRKRGEQVASLKAAQQQPGYVAQLAFNKALFGDGPYGHLSSGTAASVAKLTPVEVRSFYHTYYRLGSAVIAVVGDVKAAEVKAALEKDLTGLRGTVAAQTAPPPPAVGSGVHLKVIDRNVAQANLILGFGGIARSNPDFYRLQVLNYILGGGEFASRLMKVVRSQHGLAYSIYSGFSADKFPGAFLIVLQTKNESANEALKLVFQQLRKIQAEPVESSEIESAKKFLIGSFPLKYDRQSSIAGFLLQIQLEGLGLDYAEKYPNYVNAVTIAQLQQAARKYLHPEAIDIVAVANQKQAAIATAKFDSVK